MIELIVVIGIIASGMVAVQTAIQYGLKNATIVADGIVAAHLAEEGLELIRNVRDTNWAERAAGTSGYDTWTELGDGNYSLDYLLTNGGARLFSGAPVDCQDGSALNFDSATGLYSYAIFPQSKFRRVVTITNNTTNIDVSSQVCWSDTSGPHEITLTERLYDWRPSS